MADVESFGALLRQARIAVGLSQAGLAERAFLSVRAVSELERGNRRHPHRATLDALVKALGLSGASRDALEAAARPDRALAVPPRSAGPAASTLPAPLSRLIDRQPELAEVVRMLRRPTARLVTLTGPGGVGKTRLALEAASVLASDFADGVLFVSLDDVGRPEDVLPAIGQALDLRAGGRPALDDLLAVSLHRRRLLLLLDTCEHVVAAAPDLAALLERCPELKILATSRTPLRVRGEQWYPVPSLATPPLASRSTGEPLSVSDLEEYPAVALFVERTRERVPDFVLTAESAPAVVAICARLDGLPLAIELAAAHTAVLNPESLLARLAQRLPLLVGGPIDLPIRQRTLHDTIAWSHSLLTPGEQRLFRALAVFRGGFSLDLAEAVCADWEPEDPPDRLGGPTSGAGSPFRVLEGIGGLIEKSLLLRQPAPDGTPRFRMLGTIREFARTELVAAGERARFKGRLLDAMEQLVMTADLDGDRQAQWLARLDAERDNIRAALAWTVEQRQPERGVRLLCSLLRWFRRTPADEGYAWAEQLLGLLDAEEPSDVRARAAFLAGIFAWSLGDGACCRAYLDASVAIWRADEESDKLAYALAWQALTGQDDGAGVARRAGEEAVARFREVGDRAGLVEALHCLALVLVNVGDLATAESLTRESLAICHELGHPRLLGSGLRRLGLIALTRGDVNDARAWYGQSLDFYRTANEGWFVARGLASLAQVSQVCGDVDRATDELAETLALGRQTGDRWSIAAALEGLAWVASRRDQPARAARLYGTAAALCDPTWFLAAPIHRAIRQAEIDAVRGVLGEAAFVANWSRGPALALDRVLDEARELCRQPVGA